MDNLDLNFRRKSSEKSFEEFVNLVSKLEAIEFLGLTKVLCVEILNDDKTERDFADILEDVLDRFLLLARSQRREVLQVLREATRTKKPVLKATRKKGGQLNGTSTSDSET